MAGFVQNAQTALYRLKSLYLWTTTKHGRVIKKVWRTSILKRPKKVFVMRWPPMPAGAGGLKGVTINSEHLLFRIIYIMLIYVPWYSNKQLYSKILDSPLSLLLPYQPIKLLRPFESWVSENGAAHVPIISVGVGNRRVVYTRSSRLWHRASVHLDKSVVPGRRLGRFLRLSWSFPKKFFLQGDCWEIC